MSAERLVLVGAFAMVAGCGSLVGGDYNGEVLYEIEGVPEELARRAFRIAGHKLPIATRFFSREDQL